jgi:hypothetical protein
MDVRYLHFKCIKAKPKTMVPCITEQESVMPMLQDWDVFTTALNRMS